MSVLDLIVLRVLHARAILSCVSILYRLVECLALVCLNCLHGHSGVCWLYWPHVLAAYMFSSCVARALRVAARAAAESCSFVARAIRMAARAAAEGGR